MDLNDLPLAELLRRASLATDNERLTELIGEISRRYDEQDLHMAFDIFSGIQERDAVWIEAVVGLHNANERMRQIAANAPGSYFLFHSQSRRIMARVENGPIKAVEKRRPPKTGTG